MFAVRSVALHRGQECPLHTSLDYIFPDFLRADFFAADFFFGTAFRGGALFPSACAAISMCSGFFATVRDLRSGNRCFNVMTGANRSPSLSTRETTCGASNTSRLASFFLKVRSTSSQVMGVDTVGCSRARNE